MKTYNYILLLILSVFIYSCDTDEIVEIVEDPDTSIPNQSNANGNADRLNETIIFTDTSAYLSSLLKVEENQIILKNDNSIELDDKVFLAGSILRQAPSGFLRKITEIDYDGDRIVISTEQAYVNDIIANIDEEVFNDFTQYNGPSNFTSTEGDQVVFESRGPKSLGTFTVSMDRILYDADNDNETTYDQIKAIGTVSVSPTFDFVLRSHWWRLSEYKSIFEATTTASVDVTWSHSHAFLEESITIGKIPLPMTVFWVGPLPVVFTHDIELNLNADGSVFASITAGAQGSFKTKKGVHYRNGRVHYVNQLYDLNYSLKPLTASLGFTTSVTVGTGIDAMLYDVVGVGLTGKAGLYLEGDLTGVIGERPTVSYFGGFKANIDLTVGVDNFFRVPGLNAMWSYPIYANKWPLFEGEVTL